MNLQRLDNPQQLSPAARLEPSQLDSLATVLSRTFQDEPELVYMVPDEEARRIVSPSLFLSAIRAGQRYGEIHTTENADGVAVWIRPEHDLPFRRMVRTELMELSFNLGWEYTARYMKLGVSIEEVRKRLAPSAHWYLMVLGVEISTSEKEIGDALIAPVLSRADSTGMPCYLETFSEKRLGFYKDFGFRITGAGRIPDGGPNFWAMMRAHASSMSSDRPPSTASR
jgi:hypothetical protein